MEIKRSMPILMRFIVGIFSGLVIFVVILTIASYFLLVVGSENPTKEAHDFLDYYPMSILSVFLFYGFFWIPFFLIVELFTTAVAVLYPLRRNSTKAAP